MLTQEQLKITLKYDPDTGFFHRKINCKNGPIGSIYSSVDSRGYIRIYACGAQYRAHRLAFLYVDGSFPASDIDHIDHDKTNNRWGNLRRATKSENQKNRTLNKNNTSGCSGVHWKKDKNKWRVNVWVDGKQRCFGHYDCKHEAAIVALKARSGQGYHSNHGKTSV